MGGELKGDGGEWHLATCKLRLRNEPGFPRRGLTSLSGSCPTLRTRIRGPPHPRVKRKRRNEAIGEPMERGGPDPPPSPVSAGISQMGLDLAVGDLARVS